MEFNKSDIQKLIQTKKNDTFWNHFLFSLTKNYKIHGEIRENKIKIWQRTSLTGISYSVYSFEFDSENTLVKITDELNSFARVFQISFPLFFFFPLLSNAFTDFQITKFLISIGAFILLTFACYLMSRKIDSYNKKDQLADFYQLLNIKINKKQVIKLNRSKILDLETEEKQEKEWSTKKILTRLFTYPFCLALILLAIFAMIPDGKFIIAIPMLVIVATYLYSDLKMIFSEGKKNR